MLTPQAVSDHIEIVQTLQRYFAALDEKAYKRLDEVFSPDAVLRYSMGDRGPAVETSYPEMVRHFLAFNQVFYLTQHLMGAPLIELAGDTARSSTSLRATHVQVRLDGSRSTWVVYGIYRDAHARTSAGWRITERDFRGTHTDGELLPADQVQLFPTAP